MADHDVRQKKKMHPLIALLCRIAAGERYTRSTQQDWCRGLAQLSALPIPGAVGVSLLQRYPDASVIWIWAAAVMSGLFVVALYFALLRIQAIPIHLAILIPQYAALTYLAFTSLYKN